MSREPGPVQLAGDSGDHNPDPACYGCVDAVVAVERAPDAAPPPRRKQRGRTTSYGLATATVRVA